MKKDTLFVVVAVVLLIIFLAGGAWIVKGTDKVVTYTCDFKFENNKAFFYGASNFQRIVKTRHKNDLQA